MCRLNASARSRPRRCRRCGGCWRRWFEAERFIASISRNRFDCTEWRQAGLQVMDLRALSEDAERFSQSREN
ncbi:MAG: hypothetical protein EYC67_14155 [Betaproteobacteria bacterium]|nr:MAG: hypothetical protein EYC67_14155 [Betaproteobacteria bacterium]